MPRITIYISDAVGKGLADYPQINKSKVSAAALRRAIKVAERDRGERMKRDGMLETYAPRDRRVYVAPGRQKTEPRHPGAE